LVRTWIRGMTVVRLIHQMIVWFGKRVHMLFVAENNSRLVSTVSAADKTS